MNEIDLAPLIALLAELFPPCGRYAPTAARLEDYGWLRQIGETREAAAARIGVARSTAYRYEAAIREAA